MPENFPKISIQTNVGIVSNVGVHYVPNPGTNPVTCSTDILCIYLYISWYYFCLSPPHLSISFMHIIKVSIQASRRQIENRAPSKIFVPF